MLATLLAAFLRVYRLHELPPPAWFDEIWYELRARELLSGAPLPVFYEETSFGGANAGPVYVTALAQMMGFTNITGGRMPPALAGVLSVPLAYACFRELLRTDPLTGRLSPDERRLIALLSAVVLSYTLFYVTIGRIGMENGLAPATTLFVVWQMERGVHRRARTGWLLAGLVAGLAQYNGLHARFILPLVAFLLLQEFLMADRPARRRILIGAALMGGAGLIASLPLTVFFLTHPAAFTGRASIVAQPMVNGQPVTALEMYRHNARMIFRVFSLEGSYDPKNGVPGVPLLDVIQSAGFWAGVARSAWHLRRSAFARTLLVWLVLMSLPSLLTEGAPNLGRMIGIAPPTAALVALGWVKGYRWLAARLRSRRAHAVMRGLGIVALLGSVGWHVYLLYGLWPRTPNLAEQFTAAPVELAEEMIARAAASEPVFVELIPEAEEDIVAFEYLFPGTPVVRLDFRKCLPLPHERAVRTSYVVLSGRDIETVGKLTELYPAATVPLRDVDLFQTTGSLVEIPPGVRAPLPPRTSEARFGSGISLYGYDWSGDTFAPGETLFITLYWYAGEPVGADLTAFAHVGTGLEGQPLVAQRDGQPCIGFYPTSRWHPGEIVPDPFAITFPPDTPPGEYDLAIGWYAFPSLERLPLLAADAPLLDNRAVIGRVVITGGE